MGELCLILTAVRLLLSLRDPQPGQRRWWQTREHVDPKGIPA